MPSSASQPALFISYARDDAVAAGRIAEALRSHGLEVWFDQDELRGGDSWDQKIRAQIRTCTLLVPIISANTQGRGEGYFRREWKLAAERTHDMAAGIPFLVPVVIDDTAESAALVPEEFMRVQWTRLPHGRTTPEFAAQVKRLLEAPRGVAPRKMEPQRPRDGERGSDFTKASPDTEGAASPAHSLEVGRRVPAAAWGIGLAVVVIGIGAVFFATRKVEPGAVAGARSKAAVAGTPEKSIAVLPFANLSAEKDNEFFADGMHDDVVTNLQKIRDLKVISRTSVLAYRETAARNLKKIAEELGVATIVEGSVRRVGNQVRVNAKLIDARTEASLWADSLEGDASNIFALQATIARQIATALKATLTPGERTLIARRPTENQEAYDLFLRARAMQQDLGERGVNADYERVIAVYEQVIAKDPAFALAQAQVALVHSIMYWFGYLDPTPARAARMKAAVDAAVRLAPDAPETHLALGAYQYRVQLNWPGALAEFQRAAEGLPNDAQLSFWLAVTHRRLGHWVESAGHFERSVALNPRDSASVVNCARFLNGLRRWEQARLVCERSLGYFPGDPGLLGLQVQIQFALTGNREAYAVALEKLPPDPTDPDSTLRRLSAAMIRGDLASADRILAESNQKMLGDFAGSSVVNNPVALVRAQVAFLRGERERARQFAAEAAAYFRGKSWNARQLPWVHLHLAQTDAYSGRAEEAIRAAEAALAEMTAQDAYGAPQIRRWLGEVYLMLDRREPALAILRQMMSEPCDLSPHDIRISPLWSRLKDDPRFEEILKSAKPL